MTLSPISYNINGQAVRDKSKLLAHLKRLEPAWTVVMDSLPLAVEIKNLLPAACNVIYREWGDDGLPGALSLRALAHQVELGALTFDAFLEAQGLDGNAERWVNNMRAKVGNNDLWCYTTNEPPFVPQLLEWHRRAMREAERVGLKLCVINQSVGQPEPGDWALADDLLDTLAARPDLFVLGLHEGGCGVLFSGAPGFQTFITPATAWPPDLRALGNLYHSGRYRFLEARCRQRGIKPPRVVMTEYALDVLNDVAAWHSTLIKTPPYFDVRGWVTLREQWRAWWPQWSQERAYFEQLSYMWRALYAGGPVEGLCLFTWSANPDWRQFDVTEANELQSLLETLVQNVVDANPGVEDTRWVPAQIKPKNPAVSVNVRTSPTISSNPPVGGIPGAGAQAHVIPFDALLPGEKIRAQQPDGRWNLVKLSNNVVGWYADWVTVTTLTVVEPPAPEPDPKPTDPEPDAPPVPDDDHGPAYNALRLKIIELEERIVEMERELTALIAKEIAASESSLLTDAARHFVAFIDARQRAHDLKKVG